MSTAVPTAPPRRPRRLRIGEIVRTDGRVWRVDLVNDCRARLAPLDRRPVHCQTYDGRDVDFEAHGRSINICPESEVERIDASTLTKETPMATKKTKTPKARPAKETDLCVFALRLAPAEREALHKTAGPGGATRFARAVLIAAAARDLDAFKAALKAVEA